jgi:signal transduction histidine kinase/CheY-like chemotaxis protein
LTQWLSTYFEETQRFLEDARQRKVELEQVSESVANANRQLVLANKKMAMLSKIAEEAQKAKTVFVANVSHEFRTPLNMIIGLIDLMMRSPEIYDVILTPKMRDDLSVIFRNCEHLSNMINDVLDLTRIETGRLALFREWVDLVEIIKRGVSVVSPLLDSKHLSIDFVFSPGLPKIYCDRIRIQQVILNLLSNAARFTETGGITVKVSQEATRVLVEVMDTGPGIAPDDANKIFEPFSQGKEPVWQAKGGSGLGLSLSREFIQLHGGKMWFNSSPEQGTSFYFTIPFTPLEDPTSSPIRYLEDWVWKEDSFKSSKVSSTDSVVKPRTLIYDQSEILYPRFVRYTDQIDFVKLTDLHHLPKMNLAQAILLNSESDEELMSMMGSVADNMPVTPIIGCKVGRETQRALDLGAKGYLVKPVVYEALKKSIEALEKSVQQVLIVDDDPEIQNLFSRMITFFDSSIEIRTASSGQEALHFLHQTTPDVMLLDMVMPGMNGWQVLENVNHIHPVNKIDTLIITAQDPTEQTVSDYIITTIKGGIPMDKLFRLSVEIPRLLMEPGLGLDPVP